VMRTIRAEMRKSIKGYLSVPQFRTLTFLNRHEGASLSGLADHIGLTLPTISKMVDGLVARNLVIRRQHQDDRRRITLALSSRGRTTLQSARNATQAQLAGLLMKLPDNKRAEITEALQTLRSAFASGKEKTNQP
jgi:DNA-binding MarR family transcriptional regulator